MEPSKSPLPDKPPLNNSLQCRWSGGAALEGARASRAQARHSHRDIYNMKVEPPACGVRPSPRSAASAESDRVRNLAERLPRPLRFFIVGGLGLITDIA